jgi:hypothetical protein
MSESPALKYEDFAKQMAAIKKLSGFKKKNGIHEFGFTRELYLKMVLLLGL